MTEIRTKRKIPASSTIVHGESGLWQLGHNLHFFDEALKVRGYIRTFRGYMPSNTSSIRDRMFEPEFEVQNPQREAREPEESDQGWEKRKSEK